MSYITETLQISQKHCIHHKKKAISQKRDINHRNIAYAIKTWHVSPKHGVYHRNMAYVIETWHTPPKHGIYHRHMTYITETWHISQKHDINHRNMAYITDTWTIAPISCYESDIVHVDWLNFFCFESYTSYPVFDLKLPAAGWRLAPVVDGHESPVFKACG